MVHTARIIKDGGFVKSHIEYPVTNKRWKLMEIELSVYLDSLNLTDPTNSIFENYNDIWNWYLRMLTRGFNFDYDLFTLDPWGRIFPCCPPVSTNRDYLYDYQSFVNDDLNVHVIVTTVNSEKVYCVNVISG